jgi:voltage-gated potassium channel Kch
MIAMLIMIGITFIYQPFFYSRLIYLYAAILIMLLLGLGRFLWGLVLGQLRARGIGVSRVLIVGAGDVGRTVIRTVMAQPEFGYRVVALVDDHTESSVLSIGPVPMIEGLQCLPQIIAEKSIDEVIVALPWADHQRILDIFQVRAAWVSRAHRARSLSVKSEPRGRRRPGRCAGDRPQDSLDQRGEFLCQARDGYRDRLQRAADRLAVHAAAGAGDQNGFAGAGDFSAEARGRARPGVCGVQVPLYAGRRGRAEGATAGIQ